MPARVPTLTIRELNRALLARQFLLKRTKLDAVDAVERLACLQGQWAPSPYVALWSRLWGFERDQLTRPIDRGRIVKATLMRATLHLVSAREYPAYSFATMEGRFGAWRPSGGPELAELDKLHRSVRAFAANRPRTRLEIQEFIAEHLPARAAKDERLRNWFSWAAVATSGLVWEAAGAHFDHRQLGRHVAPPAKLQEPPKPSSAYELVVRRHLGAFGPASVADIANWSGIRVPNIRAALATMKSLRRFTDERGRELIDLSRAPRPVASVVAPPRYLARFDAAILGHVAPERTRILPEEYRKAVIFAAEVWPTFLVDGMVAGRWAIAVRPKEAVLELKPFKRLGRADRAALIDEGEKLVRFYAPESKTHGVRG
jgi:Winged helix DNA-binding domain